MSRISSSRSSAASSTCSRRARPSARPWPRCGPRSTWWREGLITREQALLRVEPEQIEQLLVPHIEPKVEETARKDGRLLAKGLNASPGVAVGRQYSMPTAPRC